MSRRVDALFNATTVFMDAGMAWLAFFLAYSTYRHFRAAPPFSNYMVMAFIAAAATVVVFFFARLYHRDGKDGYLKDMPLVLHYLRKACERYGELRPLLRLLEQTDPTVTEVGYSF